MSMTFTKLFSSITASTVWCESSDTRVVWITMLAMADKHGRVWASIPGLAKEAAVSVDACRVAIEKFLSPDPDSRTQDAEGRRIEPIDGGWRLINHAKYRAVRDEEDRRAYKAQWQREHRGAGASDAPEDKCGQPLNNVDLRSHSAEAESEAEAKKKRPSAAKDGPSPDVREIYLAYPKHKAPLRAYKAIEKALEVKTKDELLAAIKAYCALVTRERKDPEYIPEPSSWFNAGRYEDEELKPKPRPNTADGIDPRMRALNLVFQQ